MLVVPVQSDAPRDVLNDRPVGARIARQIECLAAHLDLAVGVGDGAVFFRPGRRRQHDIGVERGFGQEQILHDQMFEFRQGGAGVVRVGIGHGRIFAHDIHALDLAAMHRVHDLDHGQAEVGVQRGAPGVFEPLAHIGVADRLIIGIEDRDQPRVGRALDVVLSAQRVQPGAGPADLAGDQRQRDQAARIVGAVDVLRNPHAPENYRRFRPREGSRHVAQGFGIDAANFRHRFG